MKKWIQIILTMLGTIVALFLANSCNFFAYVSFVPKDKAYDVCITVYFTLIQIFIDSIYLHYCNWKDSKKTYVSTTIYMPDQMANLDSCPYILFNSYDVAEFYIKLSVHGLAKNIKGNYIKIAHNNQFELQVSKSGSGARIDNDGNYIICLDEICGNNIRVEGLEANFKIIAQRGIVEDSFKINIKPELIHNKCVIFKSNSAIVSMEEKYECDNKMERC